MMVIVILTVYFINMIDNFDLIANSLLNFSKESDFYFIQIIQRHNKGFNKNKLIKDFYIYSKQELIDLKSRIIEYCTKYECRAYIYPCKRNTKELCLKAINYLSNLLLTNDKCDGRNVWGIVSSQFKSLESPSLYLVDVDSKDTLLLDNYIRNISNVEGSEGYRVKAIVPTVHGFHLITTGFNVSNFNKLCCEQNIPKVEVHKNNPTLLYAYQ